MSDFSLLKTFVAVARHGSISRAADEVNLTQPAVSLQIKQLENSVGTALFHRHPIRLTDAGEHLLSHAQSVLSSWHDALKFVQEEKDLISGKLTIACSDTVMRFQLLPLIREFQRRYPGVKLALLNRTSAGAQDDVVQGRADIAYALADGQHPKLVYRPYRPYRDVAVMDSSHRLAGRRQLSAAALQKEILLLLEERTTSRKLFDSWITAQGCSIRQSMSLGSVDAQLTLAAEGMGIAIVPEFSVPTTMTAIPIRALPTRAIHLFYQRLKPASQAWLRMMENENMQAAASTITSV